MKKYLWIYIIIILLVTGCSPKEEAEVFQTQSLKDLGSKTFEVTEILEDIDLIVDALEDIHPNLYAYRPKEDFYSELEEVKENITEPMTKLEVYKVLSPLVNSLKDGHTLLGLPEFDIKQHTKMVFPIDLSITNGKAYSITEDENIDLPYHAEIVAINNIPMAEILENLMPYESGMLDTYKAQKLETTFDYFLWLHYGFINEYKVTYKEDAKEESMLVSAKALALKKGYHRRKNLFRQDDYSYWIDDGICYLDINTFLAYDTFDNMISTMFAELDRRGIDKLIIDIRDNGGGNTSLGNLLLSYISPDPFYMFSRVDVKVSQRVLDREKGYQASQLNKTISVRNKPGRVIDDELIYDGDVILLTNNYTFSAATDFAVTFKDFNVGVIMGEVTGGLASAYGDKVGFASNNTRLGGHASYKFFLRPNGDETPMGVSPHVVLVDEDNSKSDYVLDSAKAFFGNGFTERYQAILDTNKIPEKTSKNRPEDIELLDGEIDRILTVMQKGETESIAKLLSQDQALLQADAFLSISQRMMENLVDVDTFSISNVIVTEKLNAPTLYNASGIIEGSHQSYHFMITLTEDLKVKTFKAFKKN